MVKRYLSCNVIQLFHVVSTNYKKYKSYNDIQRLDHPTNLASLYSTNVSLEVDRIPSASQMRQKYLSIQVRV